MPILDNLRFDTLISITLPFLIVGGGSNKWKWVEKVGALKNYFQHRAREGGGRCVKTFILVRYKHQYQNIGNNTSKFQFIWL